MLQATRQQKLMPRDSGFMKYSGLEAGRHAAIHEQGMAVNEA